MRYRPEYDMKVIGTNLRRLRKAKGLSVDDVKEYLQLGSVQAVYKYEEGKGYPPVDNMFALMELYEADLMDIVSKNGVVPTVSGNKLYNSLFYAYDIQIICPILSTEIIVLECLKKYVSDYSMKYIECYVGQLYKDAAG